MEYRCHTTSLEGFVQQLASNILPHGYWFYVTGHVPEGKEPELVDRKLIEKYGVGISRQQRARRKLAGLANLHYLRLDRFWVLLATHGHHAFFEAEAASIRDARRAPIQVGGYSLSVKQGHFLKKEREGEEPTPDGRMRVRVQIGRERYRDLCAYLLSIACHRSAENLARELWNVPFEPYAPIRRQLLNVLRLMNAKRQSAGYAKLSPSLIRYRREIVRPFDDVARVTGVLNEGNTSRKGNQSVVLGSDGASGGPPEDWQHGLPCRKTTPSDWGDLRHYGAATYGHCAREELNGTAKSTEHSAAVGGVNPSR